MDCYIEASIFVLQGTPTVVMLPRQVQSATCGSALWIVILRLHFLLTVDLPRCCRTGTVSNVWECPVDCYIEASHVLFCGPTYMLTGQVQSATCGSAL